MKRIFAIILAAIMLCCVLVACDEGDKPEVTTDAATKAPTAEEDTTEPEETTTEEETTDDGQPDLTDVYLDVWNVDDDTHTPHEITETSKGIGVAVTIPEGGYLYEASVQAPSYSDNIGSLTIKVFAWNTDYDTTVAAEPLYSQPFVDFGDNTDLICEFEENQIPAGRILILVCEGIDEGQGVGLWMGKPYKTAELPEEYVKYGIESWINGKTSKKTIAKFALTITEPEE